jgi:hypothetical protein
MEQMGLATAQDQCAEDASHFVELRVQPIEGMEPPVDRIEGVRTDLRHAARDRKSGAAFHEAATANSAATRPPFAPPMP